MFFSSTIYNSLDISSHSWLLCVMSTLIRYFFQFCNFTRSKLRSLFNEIEKEFELLYLENLQRKYFVTNVIASVFWHSFEFWLYVVQGRASGTWDASSCQVSEKASAAGDTAELDGLRQKKQKGQKWEVLLEYQITSLHFQWVNKAPFNE